MAWMGSPCCRVCAHVQTSICALGVVKVMSVRRIDTARTTNIPIMDMADAIAAWGEESWTSTPASQSGTSPMPKATSEPGLPVKAGWRIAVFLTDMNA